MKSDKTIEVCENISATSPESDWWSREVNVVTWGLLNGEEDNDSKFLNFMKEIGSKIADRGINYGHYPINSAAENQKAESYHAHGFKCTSFNSVENWDPAKADEMIDAFKKHIDDGFDGVHLDMFFMPCTQEGVSDAVQRMAKDLKDYALQKYGRTIMFTGNQWLLDDPAALKEAYLCDVAWLESYGDKELEMIRFCHLGKAIGNYKKPVWVHLQPEHNKKNRIDFLVNLPKVLISSCLVENSVFLCNLNYPVFDTQGANISQEFMGEYGEWSFVPINDGWRKSVIQYSQFINRYRDYYLDVISQADLILLFKPSEIVTANKIMDKLILENINFNIQVYGEKPFTSITQEELKGYKYVFKIDVSNQDIPQGMKNIITVNEADLDIQIHDIRYELDQFLKVEGDKNLVTRVMVKENKRLLHIKHLGYTDEEDGISKTGPLQVSMFAPGVKKAIMVSPDLDVEVDISLLKQGDKITFSIPGVEYYSLIILE